MCTFFQLTGRKVLSEEDVIESILCASPKTFYQMNEKSMSKMSSLGVSNQQVNIKPTSSKIFRLLEMYNI